jgi:hypothetical protein
MMSGITARSSGRCPTGLQGFPLTKKDGEHTVMFDPDEIPDKLVAYLDAYAKEEHDFPRSDLPVGLKGL